MTDLANTFVPRFFVNASQAGRLRVAFNAPSSSALDVRGRYADMPVAENGASAEVTVESAEEQSWPCHMFFVMLSVKHGQELLQFNLGEVSYTERPKALLTQDDIDAMEDEMSKIAQHAFFEALNPNSSYEPLRLTASEVKKIGQPGQGRRRWGRKIGAGAVALIGLGLIAFGTLRNHGTEEPGPNPAQQVLSSGDYKELQDKIRAQVAANNGNGEFGSLQGQNIAIDTMRAMGLDPGKANSGCLVGVK